MYNLPHIWTTHLSNSVTQSTALTSNPPTSDSPTTYSPTMGLPKQSLTLILAATPSLGIGKAGALPWPMLKKEMAYFARVTKRVVGEGEGVKKMNAVIMGRKTWDSIPEKLRPLKDRLNVVLSRDPSCIKQSDDGAGAVVFASLRQALLYLDSPALAQKVSRTFVIGGASVYAQALELPQTDTVLLTKIKQEYECDTHFPVDLDGDQGWGLASKERLKEFVGEEVDGEIEEKGLGVLRG